MSEREVVRAWKDRRYRTQLSASQRARLPESPAGAVEVPEERLIESIGGRVSITLPICEVSLLGSCNTQCYCVTITVCPVTITVCVAPT